MNSTIMTIAMLWTGASLYRPPAVSRQDTNQPPPAVANAGDGELPARPKARSRAELEAEFQEMLTATTLVGSWQMNREDEVTGELSPARTERYTINSATKLKDDLWLISARIQFAENDVNVPVPVRVVWAEDTPMITLSDFAIPMLGTYSCRVIFHHGYYSGIWYSTTKKYGGIMSGRIVKSHMNVPNKKPGMPDPK